MPTTSPDTPGKEAEREENSRNSSEYGCIFFRSLEYRKGLKKGDIVLIEIEEMVGGECGVVLRNDGIRIKIQVRGYKKNGKPFYRSFWVKNGLSCGPAVANAGWGYDWLFYSIVTPPSFGWKIRRIIDLTSEDIEILSAQVVEAEDEVPF